MIARQPDRDAGAEIAALRAEAVMAETLHQLGKQAGDHAWVGAGLQGPAGEAEARQRGHDDVEGVACVAAEALGLGQHRDDLQHLDERSRPAMGDQQRQRLWRCALDVDEMNLVSVDRRDEVWPGVQRGLAAAPVITVGPVVTERLQVGLVGAKIPVAIGVFVGPAGAAQPVAQVGDRLIRHCQPVWPDLAGTHLLLLTLSRLISLRMGAGRRWSRLINSINAEKRWPARAPRGRHFRTRGPFPTHECQMSPRLTRPTIFLKKAA